eukprot:3616494-Pleurochrysis_carterae.AAC.1
MEYLAMVVARSMETEMAAATGTERGLPARQAPAATADACWTTDNHIHLVLAMHWWQLPRAEQIQPKPLSRSPSL